MQVEELSLSGLKLITPRIFGDDRGFFVETYQLERFKEAGIQTTFVQDNHSRSKRGTLRGLHYQSTPGQAKLIWATLGKIFDVVVDIRPDSATFGQWQGVYLDAERRAQLFIPVGFAHGFCVLSDHAEVQYKVSSPYNQETECGFRYDDPEIGIEWPIERPILSERDKKAESFAELRRRLNK